MHKAYNSPAINTLETEEGQLVRAWMPVPPTVCRCYLQNGGFQTLLISGLFPTNNVYISSFMWHRNIIPVYLYLPSLSTQHVAEVSELPSLSDWSAQMAPNWVLDGNPSPSLEDDPVPQLLWCVCRNNFGQCSDVLYLIYKVQRSFHGLLAFDEL